VIVLFAAVGDTGYNVVLLLHLLGMFVGFAPAWLTPAMVRLTANGDRAAADALEMAILRFSLPFLGVAGLLGFGLAGMSDKVYRVSQPWLMVATLLWLIILATMLFVIRPAIKAFRDGDAGARKIVMAGTGVIHLLLVVTLYLMVWKPGL
jgi:cytochrome c biogenesis protein CcdA